MVCTCVFPLGKQENAGGGILTTVPGSTLSFTRHREGVPGTGCVLTCPETCNPEAGYSPRQRGEPQCRQHPRPQPEPRAHVALPGFVWPASQALGLKKSGEEGCFPKYRVLNGTPRCCGQCRRWSPAHPLSSVTVPAVTVQWSPQRPCGCRARSLPAGCTLLRGAPIETV